MNHTNVHKQLLLATLALQRQEVGRHLSSLQLAAQGLSHGARDQVRTAGTWAAAASAFWSLKAVLRHTPKGSSRHAGRGIWSWGRTLLALALAVRPLKRLIVELRAPAAR